MDAARKTRAQKEKSTAGKTYTNDDVTKLSGAGVTTTNPDPNRPSSDRRGSNPQSRNTKYSEATWRSRSQYLLQQIKEVDRQIDALKEQIKNTGTVGFDASGVQRNSTLVQDRAARLRALENRKGELQKQMDALLDEGRKAGADPAWFR